MDKFESLYRYMNSTGIRYERNHPMSKLSSFKIGGIASAAAFPETASSTIDLITYLSSVSIPFYVVGNGTNMLFPDSGFPGCLICTSGMKSYSICGNEICCDAGVSVSFMARKASAVGLGDVSYAAGIPGTVGGAICMNAGAFGGEIGNCVTKCTIYNSKNGTLFDVTQDGLQFGYRSSVLQVNPTWIVLSAVFSLEYESSSRLAENIEKYRLERIAKQPLDYPSAGSTFKRPASGFAGQMIEACGLKGYAVGDASVSEKHAGFIINKGHASASDVRSLVEIIQKSVFEKFGVQLEPEIKIMEEYTSP